MEKYHSGSNEEVQEEDELGNFEKVWEQNKNEIKERIHPFVGQFTDDDCREILEDLKNQNLLYAEQGLLSRLTDILKIEKKPDLFHEQNPARRGGGRYSFSKNAIYIFSRRDDTRYLTDGSVGVDVALNEFNTEVHETFHAYQYGMSNKNEPVSELYRREFGDYKCRVAGDTVDDYASQLIEMEAYYFAFLIMEKFKAVAAI